jgi:thiamine-phosphate pyrophosphorylase
MAGLRVADAAAPARSLRPAVAAATPSGLYLLTPDWDDTSRLLAVSAAALAAGVRWLQYRHKGAAPALRRQQARALRELTRGHDASLVINDDLALALQVQADGVHLGRDDGNVAAARAAWPQGAIGVSCYDDYARAEAAWHEGAGHVAFGAVFASRVKPGAVRAPLALLERARAAGRPAVAIGGIDAGNIAQVAAAGAAAAALISAVFDAPDPAAAAAELIQRWNSAQSGRMGGP